jgi:NitT/TauT family transport system permease protein
MALYPYAVILQVTPVVAIAPLIIIWVGFERINLALLILAWIVAFFPILSSTTLGCARSTTIWSTCSGCMAPRLGKS